LNRCLPNSIRLTFAPDDRIRVRGFVPADPGRFAPFPQLRADGHPQHCGPDAIARLIPQHPEWHGGLLGRAVECAHHPSGSVAVASGDRR
jgi:hypothetical protein